RQRASHHALPAPGLGARGRDLLTEIHSLRGCRSNARTPERGEPEYERARHCGQCQCDRLHEASRRAYWAAGRRVSLAARYQAWTASPAAPADFNESLRGGHLHLMRRRNTGAVMVSTLEICLIAAGVLLVAGLIALVRR